MLVVGVVCPKAVALTPGYFTYSTAPESTLFVKVFHKLGSIFQNEYILHIVFNG